MESNRMRQHVTVVGALHIGLGALGILTGAFVFALLFGVGLLTLAQDEAAFPILTAVGGLIALFLVALSVPGIIGGIGLLRWKPWARFLVLILAVFDLLNIPIGTAVGVYTIWVLMQDETEQLFSSGSE